MLNTKALLSSQMLRIFNILNGDDNNKDISVKRGIAIGTINGILQEFNCAHPRTKCVVMCRHIVQAFMVVNHGTSIEPSFILYKLPGIKWPWGKIRLPKLHLRGRVMCQVRIPVDLWRKK